MFSERECDYVHRGPAPPQSNAVFSAMVIILWLIYNNTVLTCNMRIFNISSNATFRLFSIICELLVYPNAALLYYCIIALLLIIVPPPPPRRGFQH